MIVGNFGDDGRPAVGARLQLPRFGVSYDVEFLVDTGADVTCLHPKDATRAGVPFDRLRAGTI